jgi:hypothetical protein
LLVTVRPLLLIPLGFGFKFCRNRTGTGHVLAAEKHEVKKSNCVVLQQSDECRDAKDGESESGMVGGVGGEG